VACSVEEKRRLIEPAQAQLSVSRQCALLGLPRSSLYYQGQPANPENLHLMRLIDEQYTRRPYYGSPKMTRWLRREGYVVNHKRVARLMSLMGLQALVPRPQTSAGAVAHPVYPYLLRDVTIERANQVWSTDITYIRLPGGWLYLVAILDWYSRYVLAWQLSISLDSDFCVATLQRALEKAQPEIFNSDQGVQFTSRDFTGCLTAAGIRISMDGRGRCFDNIFVERLWRTVKYEEVYLKDYPSVAGARASLEQYFGFYNEARLHQALGYATPAEVYYGTSASHELLAARPAKRPRILS